MNSTLSIDLTKSWSTSDVFIRAVPKAPGPSKTRTALWTDEAQGIIYSWGGYSPFGEGVRKQHELWKFEADGQGGGKWSLQAPENPSLFNNLQATEYGAWANTNTTGFLIGGMTSPWTERGAQTQAIPGILTFDMATKRWDNMTLATGSPYDSLGAASAHYIPTYGPAGLIMVLGGHELYVDGPARFSASPGVNFEDLTFFDPKTMKKYSQRATGDIPPFPRAEFCCTGFQNSKGGYEV